MHDQPQSRRSAPDPETNIAPDLFQDDLRRRRRRRTPPEDVPPTDNENPGKIPAGGGVTPTPDGGNEQHPVQDEDQEDATPSDYEREIDRLDAAVRTKDR